MHQPKEEKPIVIPPKGDPARPVYLASRSMSILGALSVLVGLPVAFAIGLDARSAAATECALCCVVLLLPGIAYLVFAFHIKHYRSWPARIGRYVILLQLGSLIAQAVAGVVSEVMSQRPHVYYDPVPVIMLLLCAAVLVWSYVRLGRAGQYIDTYATRGFEPIMPPTPDLPTTQVAPRPPSPKE